ncbi:hypothetical protein HS9_02737 [Bacillus velezensis]|nr:hypothetical protein HS9_02737 [Bacillus velezensis]
MAISFLAVRRLMHMYNEAINREMMLILFSLQKSRIDCSKE